MAELSPFDSPTPGQSLTTEPGGRPWEQPPQLNDPDEVMEYYIPRIYARADELMKLVESQVPIAEIVHPLIMSGVMKGLHSIDLGVIVAGPLTDYIAGLAEVAGIDAVIGDETNPNDEAKLVEEVMSMPTEESTEDVPQENPALGSGGGGLMSRPTKMPAPISEGVV